MPSSDRTPRRLSAWPSSGAATESLASFESRPWRCTAGCRAAGAGWCSSGRPHALVVLDEARRTGSVYACSSAPCHSGRGAGFEVSDCGPGDPVVFFSASARTDLRLFLCAAALGVLALTHLLAGGLGRLGACAGSWSPASRARRRSASCRARVAPSWPSLSLADSSPRRARDP